MTLKTLLRYISFRWKPAGALIGAVNAIRPSRRTGTAYLAAYEEADAIGPLQRDEALLLHALTRVIVPRTIVEFGFHLGHSANVFLKAAGDDALVVSYEVYERAPRTARKSFGGRKNFRLLIKSQAEFTPADVDNRPVDLAFIDASHNFELNRQTFKRLLPSLAPDAIVVSHDTGIWAQEHMRQSHKDFADYKLGVWVEGKGYAHVPAERRFVDWICDTYPEFSAIHYHSANTVRHGITMLQRRKRLSDEHPDA